MAFSDSFSQILAGASIGKPKDEARSGFGVEGAIGAALLAGGFLGAALTKFPTWQNSAASQEAAVNKAYSAFSDQSQSVENQFNSDFSAFRSRISQNVQSGLAARGLTDPAIKQATAAQTEAGLSGAYAAAHAALSKARMESQGALSGTMANYYEHAAQAQYQSQMADYLSKMGIWGALGGVTVAGLKAGIRKKGAQAEEEQAQPPQGVPQYGTPDESERGGSEVEL